MTGTDEQVAAELAATLTAHVRTSGPIARGRELTRLLRILGIVIRLITHERNKCAYALTCFGSHRRVAQHVGVSSSTMQRWMEAGSPNGSAPLDDDANSELEPAD